MKFYWLILLTVSAITLGFTMVQNHHPGPVVMFNEAKREAKEETKNEAIDSMTFSNWQDALDEYLKKLPRMTRFLHYSPGNSGLGNRLTSIVSFFALAMVTNRRFLISWEEIGELFENPFANAGLDWRLDYSGLEIPNGALYLRLDHLTVKGLDWKHVLCKDLSGGPQWLMTTGNQHFIPQLALNPAYSEVIQKWFAGTSPYSVLLRFLFRPHSSILVQVNSFYKEHFTPWTISMHARHHQDNTHHPDLDESQANCIETTIPNFKQDPDAKIFVASMHTETFEYFSERFGPEKILRFSKEDITEVHDTPHNVEALTDILLLSKARTFFSSGVSTFGYVVTGYQKTPMIGYPNCTMSPLIEPCMHLWGPFHSSEASLDTVCSPKMPHPVTLPGWLDRSIQNARFC
jgi:hypothetical protein